MKPKSSEPQKDPNRAAIGVQFKEATRNGQHRVKIWYLSPCDARIKLLERAICCLFLQLDMCGIKMEDHFGKIDWQRQQPRMWLQTFLNGMDAFERDSI